ncbi:MAG: metallophosphoesterase [Nitrososphaerota archaeon]
MRILQVSDIHSSKNAEKIPRTVEEKSCDVVFVAGDITNFGTVEEAERILGIIAGSGRRVFFVAGNCDPPSLLNHRPMNERIINLHLAKYNFGGYWLVGLGGSLVTSHGMTLIELREEEIADMIKNIEDAEKPLVFLSHNPPYGSDADKSMNDEHLGSHSVRKFIERKSPILVSCGHIHEARSISRLGDTLIVNAGPAKNGYCAVIELGAGKVEAWLERLV